MISFWMIRSMLFGCIIFQYHSLQNHFLFKFVWANPFPFPFHIFYSNKNMDRVYLLIGISQNSRNISLFYCWVHYVVAVIYSKSFFCKANIYVTSVLLFVLRSNFSVFFSKNNIFEGIFNFQRDSSLFLRVTYKNHSADILT